LPHKKKRIPSKALARWHRIIGMFSAALVLLLAVTGMLINHTDALGLDKHYVSSGALLTWYGVSAPAISVSYPVGDAWITQMEDRLYYNEKEIGGRYARLLGAVVLNDSVVVGLEEAVLVLDRQGDIVEEIRAPQGLPEGIQALGESDGKVAVRGARGPYVADKALVRWQHVPNRKVRWAIGVATPGRLQQSIGQQYRNKILSVERVVRDVHNGRILGSWGHLLMDAAAVAFSVLALSGLWLWWRRRQDDKAKTAKKIKNPDT
jgi:hypothetical protein